MQFSNFPEIEEIHSYIEKYKCGIESFDFNCRERTLSDEFIIEKLKVDYSEINSIHGPYKGLDFSSKDEAVVKKTYEAYDQFHTYARELKCKRIIVHNMCLMEEDPLGYDRSVLFWKDYLDKHTSVQYCIENIVDKSPVFLQRLHDEMNDDNFKICLDIGHVNFEANGDLVEWIRVLGDRIAHVHLHNNDGSADQHNGLADGTIDMLETLTELEKVVPMENWNLETSDVETSFNWLEDNGFLSSVK